MKKKKIPRTVQDSIPYTMIYNNGIIESEDGLFSKAYSLEDINFATAPEEEQKTIFLNFENMLNSFSETTDFQILIHNFKADKIATLKEIRFLPRRDGLNKYRQDANNILLDKISDGNNSLKQNKYLVVTHRDNDVEHAFKVMNGIDQDVQKSIQMITPDKEVHCETTIERLETLFNIYHKNEESTFGNTLNKNGDVTLSLSALAKQGLSSKDLIGPESMKFSDNFFKLGEAYGRVLFLDKIPTYLSTNFLTELASVNAEMLISLHYKPIEPASALKMIRNQLTNINGEISDKQMKATKAGYSIDVISPELTASKEAVQDLMKDVVSRDQKLFKVTLLVSFFADTKDELVEINRQINTVSNKHHAPLRTLTFQQEDGFSDCLPLGLGKVSVNKILTTESASIFMPYTSQELNQRNGICYGVNQTTKNLIMYDRLNPMVHNFNGLIFGDAGSGKSFGAKHEMLSALLRSDNNRVYVIDPQSEYHKLVKALGGEVVELSPSSKTFINPFDMDIEYSGEDDPIAMKSEYILGLIEIMLGKDKELSTKEKSIVDRCVRMIYRGYIDHMEELRKQHFELHKPGDPPTIDKSASPTIVNLYAALNEQPEIEAKNLASTIEMFASGTKALFSNRSNIDTDKRIVVYDVRSLGTGLKALGLHICLNDIVNKMIENHRKGLYTWIYIDEFHLLLRNSSVALFLQEIWKTGRKWKAVPTGITHSTGDLVNSPITKEILNLSNFIQMYPLPKGEKANLSEFLQIPMSQMGFKTDLKKGHGILYTGDTILQFNNEYPTDSELYKMMETSS